MPKPYPKEFRDDVVRVARNREPRQIPVAVTCRVLKIARQPYYRWLADPVTAADLDHAYRTNALFDAHRDDPEFGYRFLLDEAAAAGQPMTARTAWRICSANKWWSSFGKKRGSKTGRSGPPVHDDPVERNFTVDAPNMLWLIDITEHDTGERFLLPGPPAARSTRRQS
ncbi:hypothetical protein [Nocardia abscessus]|uniref:hypothetical protein n=1 Tax=Nocardia abscessus TaxID=120957 RepID=UPI0024579178|nr:hypothetical protein [Nocardia abscessus]